MGLFEGFLWGVAGGAVAEVLGLYRLRREAPEQLPAWTRGKFYWFITTLMACTGGILVLAYLRSNVMLNAITAINVGASAPLLIGSFVNQAPKISLGNID